MTDNDIPGLLRTSSLFRRDERKTRARRIAMLCFCAAISGCVQNASYFEPNAPGGQLAAMRRDCSGRQNFISFGPRELEHAKASVGVSEIGPGQITVWLFIGKEGPGGFDAFFDAEEKRHWNEWFRQPMEVVSASDTIKVTWSNGGRQTERLAFSSPGNRIVTNDTYNHFYQQRITLQNFFGDWLEVQLPSMSFDGFSFDIPQIRFTRVNKVLLGALNC